MKRFIALFVLLSSFVFVSCANQTKNLKAYEYKNATKLMGKSSAEVEATLGKPSDKSLDGRQYYFLQQESSHHPEPHPDLYEFVYANDRLVRIQKGIKN